MTERSLSNAGPGVTTSVVIAILAAALAVWVGISGNWIWAAGLGAFAIVWVVLAARTARRGQSREDGRSARDGHVQS